MIAIKGMDMPKSCMKCKFTNSLHEIHYCLFNREPITDYGWQKKRPDFCPLTELPEEKDMSWEELVFKLGDKALNKSSELGCIAKFEIEPCGLSFYEDGCVLDEHNDYILTKQTPYQMWVIIKALIGDER